jgi:ubiquinone/menaquinone biosynthesis C-methylase UbiE
MEKCFVKLALKDDAIFSSDFDASGQEQEVRNREYVANHASRTEILTLVSQHHSVPVMDREVALFLKTIPYNGLILDVGGCWGWHWRNLGKQRPDVKVIILDLVRPNLLKAKEFLSEQINLNVYLVHGNAVNLPFPDATFDGCWSVQTLQHIPSFDDAIAETHRVLKNGAYFANYSLNRNYLIEWLYKLLGRPFFICGQIEGQFFLERASPRQRKIVESIYGKDIKIRYSEVIFKPELGFTKNGRLDSFLGILDSFLSGVPHVFKAIARQQSFLVQKRQ